MKDEMDAYNDSIDEMWYEIKNAPTIEIVRCKDCVEGSYKTVIDGDNVKWCDIVGMNVLDDDFCSWARMKGGDADIPKNQSIMQQSRHDDGKDLISRADAIEAVRKELVCDGRHEVHDKTCRFIADVLLSALPSAETTGALDDAIAKYVADGLMELPSAEAVQGWIPFTRRPMTEEEQKDYPNCTFIFDCVLPDDGDEILVSNGRFVWMDTFCNDIDGCYLDGGDDIDEDMAWMPLPKPYKGGEDE